MANAGNERFAPPLMYAFRVAHEKRDAKAKLDLRDEAGERVIAARRLMTRSRVSDSTLRREVMIDLICLFNTTNLDAAEDLSSLPAVRASILNYGFPDLARRTIDENSLYEVAREIETALADFEPRLVRNSIQTKRDLSNSAEGLKLRFLVKADLRSRPANVPVEFVAEIELGSGTIKIDRL
jgi:type VI secretion system protein ImpF